MLKTLHNPPMVNGYDVTAWVGDWWVAHTKARVEKALASDLARSAIRYFLPMSQRTASWGGRERVVLTVLFPSYVFFCGDDQVRLRVLASKRVAQVLPVLNRSQFVAEIGALHRILGTGQPVERHLGGNAGERRRVPDGPLRGLEGFLVGEGAKARLVLPLPGLGQNVAVSFAVDPLAAAE